MLFHALVPIKMPPHINRPAVVAGAAVVAPLLNRMEIAFQSSFVFVHSVLKWLHHPPLKNVTLRHAAAFSQDFLHSSSFDTNFDDADRDISPAPALHAVFLNLSTHLNFPPAGVVSNGNLKKNGWQQQ